VLAQIQSPAPSHSDPVDALLGCHVRIRHFTALAVSLSRPDAPVDQIAAAAQAVHRYYTLALPLHEADENESVYPRLRSLLPAGALADANQAMLDQHREIDVLVAQLIPLWHTIQTRPGLAPASAALAARLLAAWTTHLQLEENIIFPAVRRLLSPAEQSAIREEMSLRRQMSRSPVPAG